MTIEQKIFSKLEPHAKRIQDGNGNDFDYLPAVLLQLMEEQKRQAKLIDDASKLLETLKSTTESVEVQNKAQITAFESATQRKMEQIEMAIKDTHTQLQSLQTSISEQIDVFASKHAGQGMKTSEDLNAISLQIKSLANSTQQSHVKITRFLVAGLVASIVMIGLAIVIMQRH